MIIKTSLEKAKNAIKEIKKVFPRLSDSEKTTLELLLDKATVSALDKSIKEAKRGEVVSLDELNNQ